MTDPHTYVGHCCDDERCTVEHESVCVDCGAPYEQCKQREALA